MLSVELCLYSFHCLVFRQTALLVTFSDRNTRDGTVERIMVMMCIDGIRLAEKMTVVINVAT